MNDKHTKECVTARFRAWALNQPPLPPCDCADPGDRTEQVRLFLAEQLDRDDMTLDEIAAEAVSIATGASEYEPADDEDYEGNPRVNLDNALYE